MNMRVIGAIGSSSRHIQQPRQGQHECRCKQTQCKNIYSDMHNNNGYNCQCICEIGDHKKESQTMSGIKPISHIETITISPIFPKDHIPIMQISPTDPTPITSISQKNPTPITNFYKSENESNTSYARRNRLKNNSENQGNVHKKTAKECQKHLSYTCNVQINNTHSLKNAPDITKPPPTSSSSSSTTTTTIQLYFISIIKSKFLILQTLRLLFVAIIPFCSAAEFTEQQLEHFRRERSEAAQKWAPVVYLHPEEHYYPSDVHTFLHNVIPRIIPDSDRPTEPPILISMSRSLDIQALPEGPDGENTYLLAPIDPKCKNCPLPEFLHGSKPSSEYVPPTYAVITSCLPNTKTYRSPRTTETSTPSTRRIFRLKRKGRRLSLKDRWNIFRRRSASLPSYYDSHKDYIPLNSFSSLKEFSSLEEHSKRKKTLRELLSSDNEINGSERREITVLTPPSTTLLPPKRPLPTTESLLQTTIEFQESTKIEIIHQGLILDSNTTEDTLNTLSSEEEISSNNVTTATSITTTITTRASNATNLIADKVKTATQNPTPSSSVQEGETEENHIEGGDIKINNTHRFTVTYWMFYPYSQGKQLCTSRFWFVGRVFKPRLRNKCYGDLITLNSHVGDWEHVSIYFEDDLPKRMYVSTHTHGAYYQYEPNENIFVYKGKDTRIGLPLNPKYPPTIKLDGTHPILYAALGSHGLWGSEGLHRYENFLPLEDKTVEGTPWEMWKNLDVIDYKDPDHIRMDRQWLQFHGKWGNPASGCYKALLGSCDLASGPTGIPLKRENFPCHLPDHPTFFPEV